MKTLISLISMHVLIIILSCSQLFAEENLARFSIDKNIYEQLSSTQQQSLISKTQELSRFIEEKVKSQIPDYLLEKTNNIKIKILLTNQSGRDGLFIPQDSGEHTIAIQLVQLNSNGIKALLAHEIYHAIHFHINPNEAAWVREGMAQLFEYITTGELNGMNLLSAINNPLTPLLGDYNHEEKNAAQYGHNQLYFYYMYTHCGKDEFFWKLSQGEDNSGLKGSFLIDSILEKLNSQSSECLNFTDSAISFEVAKIHNQFQFISGTDKNKYFILPGDIRPRFEKITSEESLKNTIANLPVLSGFRIPLQDYINLKGSCSTCDIYFASNIFPFGVSDVMPKKYSDTDVILVKLRMK